LFPEVTVFTCLHSKPGVDTGGYYLSFRRYFKVLPDARIKWRDIIVGAFVTAVLFMAGKFGITFYISNSSIGTAYGAAGSLVIILLWVYYSSAILYFGAEFTKAYAVGRGARIYPNHYAVWVRLVEVEEEANTSIQEVAQKRKRIVRRAAQTQHVN
jgi:membrane protein